MKQPQPGDLVEIHLMKTIYEGTLLQSSEKGTILLKLNSGYNLGFNKKDVSEIKVLEKAKQKTQKTEIKKDSSKPNIAMIITGGTIASKYDSNTGGVKPLDTPESLFKFYPELFEKVNISKVEIPFMKASEDMNYKDWQKIARICEKQLNDPNIKGIIITHGTDYLHYTASALSFFLKNLNKPVVLTYSQRSIDRASSDANLNLECSALATISNIAEVMLVGHATSEDNFCYCLQGNKVKKMHTSKRDAFKPINQKPFAKIYKDRIEILREHKIKQKTKLKTDLKFEEKVALLKVYPGQSPDILNYYIKNKYKGLVLELSGLGHTPTSRSGNNWIKKIKETISKGLVICGTSQCIYGRVDPLVYSNGRELQKTGMIFLQDMLSETALVKLGWVLGHKDWIKNKETIKEKMLENISNEFNNRLDFNSS